MDISPETKEAALRKWEFVYGKRPDEEQIAKSCAGWQGWAEADMGQDIVFTITSARLDVSGTIEITVATLAGNEFEVSVSCGATYIDAIKKVRAVRPIDVRHNVILSSGDGTVLRPNDEIRSDPWVDRSAQREAQLEHGIEKSYKSLVQRKVVTRSRLKRSIRTLKVVSVTKEMHGSIILVDNQGVVEDVSLLDYEIDGNFQVHAYAVSHEALPLRGYTCEISGEDDSLATEKDSSRDTDGPDAMYDINGSSVLGAVVGLSSKVENDSLEEFVEVRSKKSSDRHREP